MELEGREFTADREKLLVIDSTITSVRQDVDEDVVNLSQEWIQVVKIPRRPPWTSDETPEELDKREKAAFVNWRRSLARLNEKYPSMSLTPFEKNLEVWRQLWRVLERSQILVQVTIHTI